MSSKILRGARAAVQPISWRRVTDLSGSAGLQGHDSATVSTQQTESSTADAYQRGLRNGEAAAQRALQPVLERLAHSILQVAALRGRVRREAESDLVKLSLAIARRILHRELSVDPEAIWGLMKTALEKLQSQEVQRVRVHPGLENAVRTSLERLAAGRNVQVVADRSREPGDVVFETERGNLDASVETQLQEIGRGLADRLRSKS